MAKYKVSISDFDYPDSAIERSILEPVGAEVIGLHCRTGAGLAEQAADADAILQQDAKIPRATIEKLNSEGFMASMGVQKVELDALLGQSYVVNVMCPHTPETAHLIDADALAKMKLTAVLINCARGKILDNRALAAALKAGRIASAGMDDTEEEPAKREKWNPADNPLIALENCVITPHVAYVSEGSLQECRRVASENAKAVLLGKTPPDLVKPKR